MISADILLKGLGGLAVVGGATTVGVCYKQEKWIFAKKKVETLTLEELAGKVGLSCKGTSNTEPTETTGVVCSKGTGDTVKVKVKRDSDSFDVSNLPATGGGKIKVYKTSGGEKHNSGFKFVVEEGDVSGEDSNKKLEEFETYEIKEDEGNNKEWRLTRKTDVNAGIKKALGLPDDEKCNLPTTTTDEKTCDLDDAKFKKINFEGGDDSKSVTGAPKLKISKVEGNDYGEKYKFKFVLESAQDATISKTVTIKKGTNTEFKIKKDTTTKTLTLEKAWTLDELVKKVGITGCAAPSNGGTPKECSFSASTKVNLFNDASNYAKQATVKSEDANKKIKVEVEQAGYSQGFKFYAEESNEITVENGTPNAGSDKKITKKGNNNSPTYEIKEQSPGNSGTKDWYLSKLANPPAA